MAAAGDGQDPYRGWPNSLRGPYDAVDLASSGSTQLRPLEGFPINYGRRPPPPDHGDPGGGGDWPGQGGRGGTGDTPSEVHPAADQAEDPEVLVEDRAGLLVWLVISAQAV